MKGKIEKLASLLNEAKAIMADIDPEAFLMLDPKLHGGVAQVHMKKPGGLKLLMKFEKDGAFYVNGKETRYRDYGYMVDGVHFYTSDAG